MAEPYTGDFALLNPFPMLRDEDGTYHCPMPMLRQEWDEDDNRTVTKVMCGEELHVEWTLITPVSDHDSNEPVIEAKDASAWAIASWWEMKCVHGHVLMTSADGDGREDAQPFDSRQAFGRSP